MDGHMLKLALRVATMAHAGAVDKAGAPYLGHAIRVADRLEDPLDKIVELLHDVLEDSSLTMDDLRHEGFPEEAVQAVVVLTRQPGESYTAFIERVAQDPRATRVKRADLEDNLDLSRISEPTERDQSRLRRYHRAYARLQRSD